MQRWQLVSLFVFLPALLAGCGSDNQGQTISAQEAVARITTPALHTVKQTETPKSPGKLTPADATAAPQTSSSTCAVTLPPNPPFKPPVSITADGTWFGTDELWTVLPPKGVWSDLPHNPGGYTQKVVWWRKGYVWTKEPEPKLMVTGRRIDAPAPPLKVSKATNAYAADIGSAMMVGVDFPTPGCWEITGRYADAELSFVVWVAP